MFTVTTLTLLRKHLCECNNNNSSISELCKQQQLWWSTIKLLLRVPRLWRDAVVVAAAKTSKFRAFFEALILSIDLNFYCCCCCWSCLPIHFMLSDLYQAKKHQVNSESTFSDDYIKVSALDKWLMMMMIKMIYLVLSILQESKF